jgi:hypothetical protein
MRKSAFLAYLFALSDRHCKWSRDQRNLIELYLAVRKAAAFTDAMEQQQVTVADLDNDQLLCWASVMQDVVDTTHRVLLAEAAQNGVEIETFAAVTDKRVTLQPE